METTQVRLVDAFADEPLGGVAVPVLPDRSLSGDQLSRVAREFGAPGAVAPDEGGLRYSADGTASPVCAAVAGSVGLAEDDHLDGQPQTLACADGTELSVALDADRTVEVSVSQSVEPADVGATALAEALAVPDAAIAEVSVPVGYAEGFGGTVLAPLMFLEHLGNISCDRSSLETLPGQRVFAFTFDTLTPDTDVHARIFDTDGRELAASGAGASGCATFLAAHGAVDDEWIRVESGRFCDRPATLDVVCSDGMVAGRGLLSLDGTVSVRPDDDDDIVTL